MIQAWENFRNIAYGIGHGLRCWMLMHMFYRGISENARTFLDNECGGYFSNMSDSDTHVLLESLLLVVKIKESKKG